MNTDRIEQIKIEVGYMPTISEKQKNTIDTLIRQIEHLAAQQNAVIYNIHFCNAGVGINWFEEDRCKIKLPEPEESKLETVSNLDVTIKWFTEKYSRVQEKRMKEGLVTYHYYLSLAECLDGELKRLIQLMK